MKTRTVDGFIGQYTVLWSKINPGVYPNPGACGYQYEFPVTYGAKHFIQSFEAVSDNVKPLKNTRATWNYFEHYKRLVNKSSGTGASVGVGRGQQGSNLVTSRYATWPPCGHRTFAPDMSCAWYATNTFGNWDIPISGLPVMFSPGADNRFARTLANEDDLRDRALKRLLPGIRPKLSLLNSVIELKDFRSLPRTIRRILSIPKAGRRTLRRILGAASDAYLQKEFNIMPLLRDIGGIQSSLKQVRDEVNKLLQNEGKRRRVHFGHDIPQAVTATQQQVSFGAVLRQPAEPDRLIGTQWNYRKVTGKSRFHAELEYTYTLPGWQRENAHILGLLDSLGVNLNPAIIWNAIPWSFVVDWVISVSRYLDGLKRRNLEPVTVIHKWCWSVHTERDIDLWIDINTGTAYAQTNIPIARVSEESYIRSPSMPSLEAALQGSGISIKEFSLAAALGGSRLR